MFKKFLSLMLIGLLAVSCIGSVAASDKFLTVYAKTQDNDGDGSLLFHDLNNDYISQHPIKKGETVVVNLSQFPGVDRIRFHSYGRHNRYNAVLSGVQNYLNAPCWENDTNFKVKVNFYKKKAYENNMILPDGWYNCQSAPFLHHDSPAGWAAFSEYYHQMNGDGT
ncbi:MAG: hypothetical protein LBD03_09720 [Methanobrevibacter sp.]|jgi:hypothetical protein|nr:hypothetical protein [Candidatus Methanovirga procula]